MRNKDILLGLGLTALVLTWGYLAPENRALDAQGVTLAIAATLPITARRRWPIPVLAVHIVLSTIYNTLDYPHDALMPPALVALYTVVSTSTRIWSITATTFTCVYVLAARAIDDQGLGIDALGTLGWLTAAIVLGEHARQRNANHAKQTRQQVTEERLRIARDLHDLLAHTITTIRVQASVAAHLITETTQPLDRATVAKTLDTITDACDQARTELRSTVEVLRDPIPVLPNITDENVAAALRAGASGFVVKDIRPADLLDAIRTVAAGERLLSPGPTATLIARFLRAPDHTPVTKRMDGLTEREREVLTLVAKGLSNHEIADTLVLSPLTVKTHVSRILTKLHARDRVHLVIAGYESGLVTPGSNPDNAR